MNDELPDGWAGATLGSVVEMRYGKGLPEHTRRDGSVPVYGSNGVVGSHSAAVTRGSAIIVGRKGSVGAVHYSHERCWPIDTTYFIEDFGPFEPAYLTHLLRALNLAQDESSTAIPGLSRDDAYRRIAFVAPLAEQRRIVEKVEDLLARANMARDRLARVPEILRRFRHSVAAAACSGRLTEDWREQNAVEVPWASEHVERVCERVVDCPHSTPRWTSSGEICLRTTNFSTEGLNLDEVRYVSRETYDARVARLEPREGDVVYSREGGILGIACLIPAGLRACLGQRMMLMRANDSIVRPGFLCMVLNSPMTLSVVRELTGGTAAPHLNVGDVKQFVIPVPPLQEQDEILRRVQNLTMAAKVIERRITSAQARADDLTISILSKAFRGELVTTEAELARAEGRGYESAAELLKRVERETASMSKPPSRKRQRRRAAT